MCTFTWTHLLLAGLGFDIAGAVIIAWSLATATTKKLANEIPRFSNMAMIDPEMGASAHIPDVARGLARQRAEARLGFVLLGIGFLMQAISYFTSSLHDWPERSIGAIVFVVAVAAGVAAYRIYVPWSSTRTYDEAQRHLGKS